MATTEVTVGLHVADHGLDCRATSEFAFDGAEDAALLTGDEDAARVGGVVAAIALVDIGALDGAAGELLGGIDDAAERMSIIGVAGQCLGTSLPLFTQWKNGLVEFLRAAHSVMIETVSWQLSPTCAVGGVFCDFA